MLMLLALKLVLVTLSGIGSFLPTLSFFFLKSSSFNRRFRLFLLIFVQFLFN
jgi:hypothetical protein